MFQKVLASLGSGGAKVDARLLDRNVRPGAVLRGEIDLTGGQVDQEVTSLGVTLLARVDETDERGRTSSTDIPITSVQVASKELVRAGAQVRVPFQVQLPLQTPLTSVLGRYLSGMAVGLQTNLNLAGTVVDPQDVDAVLIEPLPAQHRLLDAMSRLGFQFGAARLDGDRLDGVEQQLPFHQVISFTPPQRLSQVFREVALVFLARPRDLQVVLDVTKVVRVTRGAALNGRTQSFLGSFVVEQNTGAVDWERQIDGWLRQVAAPRGIFD